MARSDKTIMKLLTHNMLTSHVKGVKNGFPLRILVSMHDSQVGRHPCSRVFTTGKKSGSEICRLQPRLRGSHDRQTGLGSSQNGG